MIHFLLIIGLFLLAVAVIMVARAVTTRTASTETIEQIGAYGFAGSLPSSDIDDGPGVRGRFEDITGALGRWPAAALREAPRERLPLAAHRRGHVHDDARATARHAVRRGDPAARSSG